MRIEKVSDNQIRCTLTKEDLADRQLKLSELAYGTEKAKSLFRDMMQQAAVEFGFEADNIPLMIEAVPVSMDTIVLIITKVEYPEELDTRFSQFSPASDEDMESQENHDQESTPTLEGAGDILELFRKLRSEKADENKEQEREKNFIPLEQAIQAKQQKEEEPAKEVSKENMSKLFVFDNLDDISSVASILCQFYHGKNELYRNAANQQYYLFIHKDNHTPEEFNKVCNILSEYGKQQKYTRATEAYFEEHFKTIIRSDALTVLDSL